MGRGVAVVLFTDLVGSTELRSRLGEEAAEELRRAHDRVLTQAVEANDGRVVKGLGDGIMATFAGASDAVAAAVAIQQAVDRLNRSAKGGTAPEVRVGISAGDVTVEDDDVHGTPVIEAARLCGVAAGAEILASEMVRWLARASASTIFTPAGSLQLKGLPEPVPAVRVGWEPLALSPVPLPGLLTDVGRIFVGRDAELELLGRLWKEATAGERRVALLAGEPGVGKTRLAAELAAQVHDEGATVLAGRCDEDLGVPYQPFVEALRHFVDHTPAGLQQRLGRYGSELARLVPELSERVSDLPPPLQSDPETERYRLFDAVAGWMAAASSDQPVLLVLDDLQWAAKPTLLLLRHVVRSSEAMRLLVVGTYRDSELDHDHPLIEVLADLRRQREVERFPLVGLDSSDVAAFVAQASGQALDDQALALARAIHLETEGNPFFVREVLRHLAETKAVVRHGDVWSTRLPIEEMGIPEGVREVVGKRLGRLSGAANKVLRAAAVVGAEFEPEVVRAAGSFDEEELITALEEATAARLVVESAGGRYRFAHALVRDTLYNGLAAVRRVALHRHVAESIESIYEAALDDHLPALAHHWGRAAAPAAETHKAVAYARRAGDRALAQLAQDEAVTYYRQALELIEGDEGCRVDLLIRLGEAQRRAGDPAHRRTLLDAADLARGRGDTEGLVRAALANSRAIAYSRLGELDPERIAVLEAALADVAETDVESRARLMANLAVELVFADDRARRVALSDAALDLARTSGNDAVLAHVLTARYYTILAPDTLPERLANTGELVEVTERLGDPFIAAMARFFRVRTAMETADMEEADRCLAALEGYAADLRQPFVQWVAQFSRTGRELLAGRYDIADSAATDALQTGRTAGQHEAFLCYTLERFQTQIEQDRLREVQQSLAEVTALGFRLPLLESLRALLACELDQENEARLVLADLGRDSFSAVPINNLWLTTIANCAALAAALADPDRSGELYRMLRPYASQLPVALLVPSGAVAYYLGMLAGVLGLFDAAEEHFASAEAIHERIGAPVWLARTRLEWARMLLTRRQPGDAEGARELLGQALATARELGLANVERRAVALLQEGP